MGWALLLPGLWLLLGTFTWYFGLGVLPRYPRLHLHGLLRWGFVSTSLIPRPPPTVSLLGLPCGLVPLLYHLDTQKGQVMRRLAVWVSVTWISFVFWEGLGRQL